MRATRSKPRVSAPPARQRGIHDNRLAVGMRAFFAIVDKWGLSADEARALLGHPSKSTFYNWKKGDIAQVAHSFDLASRISYVLGIFKSLEILYQRPDMADQWIRQPNAAFGGQSAMDRMRAGHVVDLAAVAEQVLADCGLTAAALDLLVPHQANKRIIEAVGRRLDLPAEKVVVTVDRHANTSAASIPLALEHAVETGRLRSGQLVCANAMGGGFAWGAALIRW